jgi:hypothetical protein
MKKPEGKIERLKIPLGAIQGAAAYGREKSSGIRFLKKGGNHGSLSKRKKLVH